MTYAEATLIKTLTGECNLSILNYQLLSAINSVNDSFCIVNLLLLWSVYFDESS